MISMRLARHGAKKRPYYHIVVADSRAPRDGRFIERIGSYNPMLPRDHKERVSFDDARVKHWLSVGAQPTDRVSRLLEKAGVLAEKKRPATPKKSALGAKAQERIRLAQEAKEAAEAEAKAAAEAAAAE